jgi:hypothetical protein
MEDDMGQEHVDKPYGGLFGDNALTRIIEEIVADPYTYYRPKDFEDVTGSSAPSIRKALAILTKLGLLRKDAKDPQHPIYQPVTGSKTLLALTLLSYAMIDDRKGTDCLKSAILEYYKKEGGDGNIQNGEATLTQYDAPLEKIIVKFSNGKDICFSCEAAGMQK